MSVKGSNGEQRNTVWEKVLYIFFVLFFLFFSQYYLSYFQMVHIVDWKLSHNRLKEPKEDNNSPEFDL